MPDLRSIPAVGRLLDEDAAKTLIRQYGRDLVVKAIRETIDRIRSGQRSGHTPDAGSILHDVVNLLDSWVHSNPATCYQCPGGDPHQLGERHYQNLRFGQRPLQVGSIQRSNSTWTMEARQQVNSC